MLADGEAVLTPEPGKVMTIFPPLGMAVVLVNWMVCMAVMPTVTGSPL